MEGCRGDKYTSLSTQKNCSSKRKHKKCPKGAWSLLHIPHRRSSESEKKREISIYIFWVKDFLKIQMKAW
jgi:hypothetical protein